MVKEVSIRSFWIPASERVLMLKFGYLLVLRRGWGRLWFWEQLEAKVFSYMHALVLGVLVCCL